MTPTKPKIHVALSHFPDNDSDTSWHATDRERPPARGRLDNTGF